MIVYLDASALVKLYAAEEHRASVEKVVAGASLVASALVVYAEARAALARKEREGTMTREQHDEAVAGLDDVLEAYALLPVDPEQVFDAGDLAREHALRGYDAVHLAAASSLRDESLRRATERRETRPREPERTLVVTFDKELYRAARTEGFAYELPVMENLVGPAATEGAEGG